MSSSRSTTPPRREYLVNEYQGASDAAFAAIEQVNHFSNHARNAKANRDWKDEQDLWDSATHHLMSSIRHRDYELKCRKEEYRLYKQYMLEIEQKVQKSIMAYCKRRIYRLRTWEMDNLRMKGAICHLDRKIWSGQKQYEELQRNKAETQQTMRISGVRRAHVTSFGDGWDRRTNGARASAHNESFEMRLINISISRCANWIKKSIKEKDESIITWQKNKEAHEDFQLDWISKDEAARRLLDAYEAQRNALLDPHTRNQAIESIEAVIWRNEGDGWGMAGDAQNIHMRMDGYDTWQEDFDRALDEDDDDEDLLDRDNSEVPHNPLSALQGSRRRSRRDGYSLAEGEEHFEQHQQHQQNLLSPTPVRGETEDLLQEATFKYAGLRLKDEPLEGADSGYDSGLTCAASTAEASSTLAPEGPKSMQAGLGGWDAPLERVSSEATWQAAFDAFNVGKGRVGDDLHATGYTGTRAVSMNGEGLEDWEYDYAQE